jgi:hypothetical protein
MTLQYLCILGIRTYKNWKGEIKDSMIINMNLASIKVTSEIISLLSSKLIYYNNFRMLLAI